MARKMLFPCLIGLLACAMSVVATAQVEYIDPAPVSHRWSQRLTTV